MKLKIALVVATVIAVFLIYVSTRESKFVYERSGVINAPAEKIFPYLVSFRRGSEWSPYEKADPSVKTKYLGTDGEVGSAMEFDGSSGTGKVEVKRIVPNELVALQLTMTKPFRGDNEVVYRLIPEASGTRFSWSMSGDGGFLTKLISVFIDCEKMVAGQFSDGIANLKTLIESQS